MTSQINQKTMKKAFEEFPVGNYWVKLKDEYSDPYVAIASGHFDLIGKELLAKSPPNRDIVGFFIDEESEEPIFSCNKIYAAYHFGILREAK